MTLTIGQMIKIFREHNSMSMQDFAERAGITKAYISLLERGADPRSGKHIQPTIETLDAVASAMGMSAPDLLTKMEDDNTVIETYPYKTEIEQEAAKMTADQLRRLLAYAKFLQQEGHDD